MDSSIFQDKTRDDFEAALKKFNAADLVKLLTLAEGACIAYEAMKPALNQAEKALGHERFAACQEYFKLCCAPAFLVGRAIRKAIRQKKDLAKRQWIGEL